MIVVENDFNNISFVEFDCLFLHASYLWLQDMELCNLLDVLPPTEKQQEIWFNGLLQKGDYKIFGVNYENIPIGVCGLKNITKTTGEYFGYIGEKEMWGKGIGRLFVQFIEKYARDKGLSSIYLRVLRHNVRAMKLYKKLNYTTFETYDSDELIKMIKFL